VEVAGPIGSGGAGFASYIPLAQGSRVDITQGPGELPTHNTIYTQDAIDLGVPTGTEVRAGFTGVVARVNTGCLPGHPCASGYGNYVYLKAADGTCAVMAHLSKVDVTYGQQITQYDLIGLSGWTGAILPPNSGGAHLHYDHVDCANNRSLPWIPIEGGSLRPKSVSNLCCRVRVLM
jgi:murein DD-endopeptidase MepM/ murein hydrolase activator NlpD